MRDESDFTGLAPILMHPQTMLCCLIAPFALALFFWICYKIGGGRRNRP